MADGRSIGRVAAGALKVVGVLVLLGMSWTALHDIIKGQEDITGEVTFLVFAALLVVSVVMSAWMRARSQAR
jgi:hypothetical protein